jgi:hypothetical protein
MKTKRYSFLRKSTKLLLRNLRKQMLSTASEAPSLFFKRLQENTLVIPTKQAEEWIDNLPEMLGYQTAVNKLSRCQVYALERRHFESKFRMVKNIEKYVSKFTNDTLADDFYAQILTQLSVPLNKAISQRGSFLVTHELQASLQLRKLMASILYDVGGYNTFYGIYYERNINELMRAMDTSINLINESSIIPVRIFSDFVEIVQAEELISTICNIKVGNVRDIFYAAFNDDIDIERDEMEARLFSFVEKYPCLKSKEFSTLGKHLLDYYTREPLDIISQIGQDVVCFPFRIPDHLLLTESEKSKRYKGESSIQSPKILF